MGLALFSGLVRGFGRGMEQGYERKAQQDYQDKAIQRQLAMSALMNDPNLTGAHRRAGLAALGMPDEIIQQIVPDDQVETGQYAAAAPPVIRPMPTMEGGVPEGVMPPTQQGAFPKSPPQPETFNPMAGGAGMQPMPRNPLVDQPQVLPAQAIGGVPSTAPVTQKYTSGYGSKIDELDARIQAAKDSLQHGKPIMGSSLNMTRQQMADVRQRKLNEDEQERSIAFGSIEQTMRQKAALETASAEMQMRNQNALAQIGPEFAAHVKAIGDARGAPLNATEINQLAGLKQSPADQEIAAEAQLQTTMADPTKPLAVRQAAADQYRALQTERLARKVGIQNTLSEMAARAKAGEAKDLDPNKVHTMSTYKAMSEWTPERRDAYIRQKAAMYEQQLTSEIAHPSGMDVGNAEMTAVLQQAKLNPASIKATAIRLAAKDADKMLDTMTGTFFTYTMNGLEPIMLREVLDRINRVEGEANKNKMWDAVKNGIADKKIVVLNDDMSPWQSPGPVRPTPTQPNARIPRRSSGKPPAAKPKSAFTSQF